MKKSGALLFGLLAFFVCGCGSSEPPKAAAPVVENSAKEPLSKTDELRKKANFAEAASLVGYDGKAIKESLNKVIDEQEKAAKQLEDLKDIH